jgi:hypothetical protein
VSEKAKEPRLLTDLQIWTDFVLMVWTGAKTHQMKNLGYPKSAVTEFMKVSQDRLPTKFAVKPLLVSEILSFD